MMVYRAPIRTRYETMCGSICAVVYLRVMRSVSGPMFLAKCGQEQHRSAVSAS